MVFSSLNKIKRNIQSTNQTQDNLPFFQDEVLDLTGWAAWCLAGMEVLNRAIESIMNSTDRDDWEPTVIHISDKVLSLWKGEVPSSHLVCLR